MSDSDSFINEVTEEVRRDRLYALLRRYGWIAALVILAIVVGAAYSEFSKAQARAQSQALGDAIIASLGADAPADRAAALAEIEADTAGGAAVVGFLTATAQANSDQQEAAIAALGAIAQDGDLPLIYRHIATFKSLNLQAETLPSAERRIQYEALAQPGAPLRLLAEEQLALIEVAEGDADAAIARLQAILADAEVTADLQQRVAQVIVALGGEPQTAAASQG